MEKMKQDISGSVYLATFFCPLLNGITTQASTGGEAKGMCIYSLSPKSHLFAKAIFYSYQIWKINGIFLIYLSFWQWRRKEDKT